MTQPVLDDSESLGEDLGWSRPIERVRYGCSLGAVNSAAAIPRVVPVTHCGPGCAAKQFAFLGLWNGHQGSGYAGGALVPSTNMTERDVVFGGNQRLAELLRVSAQVMDADLFVVLTGCVPSLIGDDAAGTVLQAKNSGLPVVLAETSGLKGNNFTGHETVIRAILDQWVGLEPKPRRKGVVNLWSVIPFQHPFWRGDLAELTRLLRAVGLEVRPLFGYGSSGVSEWASIPEADLNLVVSPWVGLDTASHLETVFGQKTLHWPALPIGAKETSRFLREVVRAAGVEPDAAESLIAAEERQYYQYLKDFADFFADPESDYGLPVQFVIVADSTYALAYSNFLNGQLGLAPSAILLTENPPDRYRNEIRRQFQEAVPSAEIVFESDGIEIQKRLSALDFPAKYRRPAFLGSTWEEAVAKEKNGILLEISFPVVRELVIHRTHVGYQGALRLLEDLYSAAIRQH